MFRYDAFITLDFQKVLPACHEGFYQWYISIQLRNLETIYWVQWRSQEVEVGENSVWPSLTQLGDGLTKHVGGVNWGRSPNRGREASENWGRSPNRSPNREPLSRKFVKIHTCNHAFWCIVEAKIYIFPADPGFSEDGLGPDFELSQLQVSLGAL